MPDRKPVEEIVDFLEEFAGDSDAVGGFDACDWDMCPLSLIEEYRQNLREAAARLREEYL